MYFLFDNLNFLPPIFFIMLLADNFNNMLQFNTLQYNTYIQLTHELRYQGIAKHLDNIPK